MTGKNRFCIWNAAALAALATPVAAQDSAPQEAVEAPAEAVAEDVVEQAVAAPAAEVAAPAEAAAESPPSPPPAPVDHSQDAAWHNAQQAFLSNLKSEDGWGYMPGGLRWRRSGGDGTGQHPTIDDTVAAHYAGGFVDGSTFDSSYGRGQPAVFPVNGLIKGWQMILPQMGVGDRFDLAVPADLAYGAEGRGPIPGGATLLFTIELLGIKPKDLPPEAATASPPPPAE